MVEVEVKVAAESLGGLEKKLKDMNFSSGKYLEEKDTYFNSEFHDFVKSGEAFRIRRVLNLETMEES